MLAASSPAVAGQPNSGLELFGAVPDGSAAESGKPKIGGWPTATPQDGGAACAAPLPCGTRLRGSVRKDGAVELQVPALRLVASEVKAETEDAGQDQIDRDDVIEDARHQQDQDAGDDGDERLQVSKMNCQPRPSSRVASWD